MLRKNPIEAHLTRLRPVGSWHDRRVIALVKIALQLLADVLWFVIAASRPSESFLVEARARSSIRGAQRVIAGTAEKSRAKVAQAKQEAA
jgi:hypothetical protein